MRKRLKIPEPTLAEINTLLLALTMVGVSTNERSVDLILRTQYAYKKMGDGFDLWNAACIMASINERWNRPEPDTTSPAVWEGKGFLGYKTKK